MGDSSRHVGLILITARLLIPRQSTYPGLFIFQREDYCCVMLHDIIGFLLGPIRNFRMDRLPIAL